MKGLRLQHAQQARFCSDSVLYRDDYLSFAKH